MTFSRKPDTSNLVDEAEEPLDTPLFTTRQMAGLMITWNKCRAMIAKKTAKIAKKIAKKTAKITKKTAKKTAMIYLDVVTENLPVPLNSLPSPFPPLPRPDILQ